MAFRTAFTSLLAVLAASPAPAAADWSRPQNVSGPTAVSIVSLGFDQRGRGLMGWSAQPGRRNYTAALPPGGTWAAPRLLPERFGWAGFAVQPYARSRAVMVAKIRRGGGRRVRYEMGAAFGTSAGDFGEFQTLDSGPRAANKVASESLSAPVLSVNTRGAAIAAWMRYVDGVASIRVAERRAGGQFRQARTVGRSQAFPTSISSGGFRDAAAVAIDARGSKVVSWYRERRVEARIRRAGGDLGTVQRIGRAVHPPPTISAAASRGRFLVAWGTLAQTRDKRFFRHTAALRPRGRGWATWRLERFTTAPRAPFHSAERQVGAAFDSDGRAVAAWTGAVAGHAATKLAIASGRRFGPTQTLSGASGARFGGLASGPRGRLAVSWTEDTGVPAARTLPYARVGSHPEGFSPPELIGRCPVSPFCGTADVEVAINPVSAQPTAAWVERLEDAWVVLSATRL